MVDEAYQKYEKTKNALCLECINNNLIKKGINTTETFYREYNLPENKSHSEFAISFNELLGAMNDAGEEKLCYFVEELQKLNPELSKIQIKKKFRDYCDFVLYVIYKMQPEDIDWYLNERESIENFHEVEGAWARWVQQIFEHNYAYMICPANRKKLEELVNKR